MNRSIHPALRYTLLWLGMAALMLGAALPRGWMPSQSSESSFTITVCSAGLSSTERSALQAKATAAIAEISGPDDHSPADPDDNVKHCPYGVAAHAVVIDVPTIQLSVAIPEPDILAALPAVGIGCGLAAPPPPSTGPPIHT